MLVRVTLCRKYYNGIVLRLHDNAEAGIDYKPILDLVSEAPVVSHEQIELWQWVAHYYMCRMGDVLKAALPVALFNASYKSRSVICVRLVEGFVHKPTPKQQSLIEFLSKAESQVTLSQACEFSSVAVINLLEKKGVIEKYESQVSRFDYSGNTCQPNPLSDAQSRALAEIEQIFEGENRPVLLHGITSSGKTEIYIRLIKDTIESGGQVLYLVPEIALTTQLKSRLEKVFGGSLLVYHSKLNDQERAEVYNEMLYSEKYRVVLGVRSSVFISFKNLKLIIVDEQHDQSYKQLEPAPRYNAANTALMLARFYGARVVMGSATPTIEAYYNAISGRWGLVTLNSRYGDVEPPVITVVDMVVERQKNKYKQMFSWILRDKIVEVVGRGEQVILFHNRRGHSTYVNCPSCGWVPTCDSCAVTLTYHKKGEYLSCHYCGHREPMPIFCPVCGGELDTKGYGTERVEEVIHEFLTDVKTLRLDLDSVKGKNSYQDILQSFANGDAQILIGTQMVSKGLDFENVSLVGIINADTLLDYPDFRATEQSFQTLLQVSGRSGRSKRRGEVVLQTSHASYPIIEQIVNSDYQGFYDEQSALRGMLSYPPFSRIVFLYVRGKIAEAVNRSAKFLASELEKEFSGKVLGPENPPVAKVNNYNIKRIVIKIPVTMTISDSRKKMAEAINRTVKHYASIQIYADIDPL